MPFAVATIDLTTVLGPPLQMPLREDERHLSVDERVTGRLAESETLDQIAQVLYRLLGSGFAVWGDGQLLETRVQVAMLNGLRLEIHTREHGPPHFHVTAHDIDATFAIRDCAHLAGTISRRDQRLVEYWHRSARPALIRVWNATRPSDCPAGPITA